ncbi:MAG: SEC-C domain-containing protein, partial [Planctomycetaceae bacterium]|nr:SEC-C domain-containing protein [Planctomycetaceae bacterium]
MGLSVDADELRDMSREQMIDFLKGEGLRQAELMIEDKLDETLSTDMDPRDWGWQALSAWANEQFSLNTNDRELRKIAREGMPEGEFDRAQVSVYLNRRASESIERTDFRALEFILAEDFGRKQLSGWLGHHFGVEISPDEFAKFEVEQDAIELIQSRTRDRYHEKEILFPVLIGINRYLMKQNSDREGLIQWCNSRFQTNISEYDLKEKERDQVIEILAERSRTFYPDQEDLAELEARVADIFDGDPSTAELRELVDYLDREFNLEIDLAELQELSRDEGSQYVFQKFGQKYRAELGKAERDVLLELVDHSWKEHLYFMDHLKSGIGLVGYAQKDPKVEYKREGMKAFEQMWDGISERVTSAIFRLESDSSPQYLDSLWSDAIAVHSAAPSAADEYETNQSQTSAGGDPEPVKPIRNFEQKVGRNDPCPCGSGKKFKKCCLH